MFYFHCFTDISHYVSFFYSQYATYKEVSTHALVFCVYQIFRPEPVGTGFERIRTLMEHAAEQVWTNKGVALRGKCPLKCLGWPYRWQMFWHTGHWRADSLSFVHGADSSRFCGRHIMSRSENKKGGKQSPRSNPSGFRSTHARSCSPLLKK